MADIQETEHKLKLLLECDCGHAILNLSVDKLSLEGYWDLYELNFYTFQEPFWNNFKENMRLIWSIIRGKRYCLYGVMITKDQWEELKEFINNLDTTKETKNE